MAMINSDYTTHQTEMVNILQIFHKKKGLHASTLNFKKGKENYGPTPTQMPQKQS